jgi:hypothetical protein
MDIEKKNLYLRHLLWSSAINNPQICHYTLTHTKYMCTCSDQFVFFLLQMAKCRTLSMGTCFLFSLLYRLFTFDITSSLYHLHSF